MNSERRQLREARKADHYSAIALARLAQTTEPRIYAFERSRYAPGVEEARRIAKALGRPAVELFPDLEGKLGQAVAS